MVAGKYRLLKMLGEGGMGAVWRAHYETLDVDVALKVLRPDPDDEDSSQDGERLLQEARAAAQLRHPAIARVYDYGLCDRGEAFIVMELLEGEDLAHGLARRGRLSPTKAVATLLPIIHALSAAHQKGIVHRDIKPDNIYLARTEDRRIQPKLVDFGIAKVEKSKDARLTQTGVMLGSPLYMSPEQARGEEVDHRADIWSICVVLYELIAGTTPFGSATYTGLLYAIIAHDPTPLTSLAFGDARLWEIVERGLSKDRRRRWSSMRELGQELASWLIARGQREDITGASLHQQWFRRVASKADLLASLMPPPDEGIATLRDGSAPRPSRLSRMTDIDVDVAIESDPEESTFTGGVVSVPKETASTRGRLLAIAFGSAALGALLVVSGLSMSQLASPSGDAGSAAAVQVVQMPEAPQADLELAVESAPPVETACAVEATPEIEAEANVGTPPAVATAAAKPHPQVAKRPHRSPVHPVPPSRRSQLKNPFE